MIVGSYSANGTYIKGPQSSQYPSFTLTRLPLTSGITNTSYNNSEIATGYNTVCTPPVAIAWRLTSTGRSDYTISVRNTSTGLPEANLYVSGTDILPRGVFMGTANITATMSTGEVFSWPAVFSCDGRWFVEPLTFKPGTLAAHISANAAAAFDGAVKTTGLGNIWSANNFNVNALVATRSPTCVLAGNTNLTCFSAAKLGRADGLYQATLISPRHLISANHVGAGVGSKYAFVGADGLVYTATVTKTVVSSVLMDTMISYLDAAMPAAVTPASIFPDNYTKYMPHLAGSFGFSAGNTRTPPLRLFYLSPVAGPNIQIQGVCFGEVAMSASGPLVQGLCQLATYTYKFIDTLTVGDTVFTAGGGWMNTDGGNSGAPTFCRVNNDTVLITQFGYSGIGGLVSGQAIHLNSLMNSVKDKADTNNYGIREVDLRSFIILA